jgi:hypothetical protein
MEDSQPHKVPVQLSIDSGHVSAEVHQPEGVITSVPHHSSTANPVVMSPITTTISASALVEILNSVTGFVIPSQNNSDGSGAPIQVVQLSGTTPCELEKEEDNSEPKKQSKGSTKQPWHYHLGGVRHCRVPLSAEIKEALEVAYVSRIMSKNFRREGQPEKERIAQLTGLEIEKVQEWFKNRRKKDKLVQSRINSKGTPKGKRGRKLLLPHSINKQMKSKTPSKPVEDVSLVTDKVVEP